MPRLTIQGRLTAAQDRRLRGRLLPYGRPGYTNLGRVVCQPGDVEIPEDVATLFAHLDHLDERDDVAVWEGITEESDGLWAEWSVPMTHGGDRLLAEFQLPEGDPNRRTGISVELEPVRIVDGRAQGVLIGCAFPRQPAFDDARLVAELAPDTPVAGLEDAASLVELAHSLYYHHSSEELEAGTWEALSDEARARYVEAARAAMRQLADGTAPAAPAASSEDGETLTAAHAAPQTPGTDAGETHNTGEAPMSNLAPAATAPAALLAGAVPPAPAAAPATPAPGAPAVTRPYDFFRLLAQAHRTSGTQRARLLAALSDIVPADVVDMEQPQWVGELWSGVSYQRRFVPLINRAPLTSLNIEGWRWVTKPEVDVYAGNKAPVPSNDVDTEPVTKAATRWAGAHDIDRAHRDFGNAAFFAAYYAAMTESYARKSDNHIPGQLKAGATVVTPGTVPTDVSLVMAAIVDGALAVLDEGVPSFAIVEKDLYRSLLLTPKDAILEFLSASLQLDEGSFAGFRIVPQTSTAVGDASSTTGLDAGEVLVGVRNAATFYELGESDGVPIRAEAVDMVNGGIDAGVFGYGGVVVHNSAGLALVDTNADSA